MGATPGRNQAATESALMTTASHSTAAISASLSTARAASYSASGTWLDVLKTFTGLDVDDVAVQQRVLAFFGGAEDAELNERTAALIKQRPSFNVQVSGHTDSSGPDAYNQDLSQRRAQSVVDYLVGAGVDAEGAQEVALGPTAGDVGAGAQSRLQHAREVGPLGQVGGSRIGQGIDLGVTIQALERVAGAGAVAAIVDQQGGARGFGDQEGEVAAEGGLLF